MAINAVTAAVLSGRFPTDEEAAVRKGRYRRIFLTSQGLDIDPELIANRNTLAVIQLTVDTIAAAILKTGPGDHKARIRPDQAGDVVHLLIPGNLRIGQELITNLAAVLVKHLALNIVAATIVTGGVVFPGDDKAAAVQARNFRLVT